MSERGLSKTRVGVVISDKMDKSIVVEVTRTIQHPLYKKYIRKHSKVQAHDERNEAGVGDMVELMECRPLSKSKRWRLVRVVEKAKFEGGVS